MEENIKLLKKIKWCIDDIPNEGLCTLKNKKKNIVDYWNKILFEKDTKIKCMLHNFDKYHVDILIIGPISIKDFLMKIYEFYQLPMEEKDMKKAFKGNREWKEEVLRDYNNDKTKIKNIDVFDGDPAVTFEGLEKIEDDYYNLILGPI